MAKNWRALPEPASSSPEATSHLCNRSCIARRAAARAGDGAGRPEPHASRFCLIVARLRRVLAEAPEARPFPEAESGVLASDSRPVALRQMGTSDGGGKLQPLFATRRNILKSRWVFNIPGVSTATAGVGSQAGGRPGLRGRSAKVAPWQWRSVFCPEPPSTRSRQCRCRVRRCGSPFDTKKHGKTGEFHCRRNAPKLHAYWA